MHDAEVVGARERGAHLLEDVDGAGERHRAARELARERGADEVLHHQVELAVFGLADVVDVDDVRVIDAVGGARFAQHPRAQVGLAAQVGANQLERDDPVDEHVARAIDDAHAAFAELVPRAGSDRRRPSRASDRWTLFALLPPSRRLVPCSVFAPALTCQIRSHNDIGCFSALWSRAGDDVTEKAIFVMWHRGGLSTMTEQENDVRPTFTSLSARDRSGEGERSRSRAIVKGVRTGEGGSYAALVPVGRAAHRIGRFKRGVGAPREADATDVSLEWSELG